MHVTVAVPTKQRPESLLRLLRALMAQQLSESLSFEVVVVDNDAAGSACQVAASVRGDGAIKLTYVVEEIPGVSAARNRALAHVRGDAVAFIDDDEVPCSGWLRCLVDTMQTYDADMVFGPVLPDYDAGVARWIVKSGAFRRRRLSTGRRVKAQDARSGNVLIATTWLARQVPVPRFDLRLGLTGGEDTLFFSRALKGRCTAVWCDEAEVNERVPLDRATARYLARRWYQIGVASCMISEIENGRTGVCVELVKGLILFPAGLFLGTATLPFDPARAARMYMKAICGAGKVASALGHRTGLRPATAAKWL